MAFKMSDIDPMYVRNGLDHDSCDVGTLCLSNKINPWSERKPMDINSANYAARQVAIASTSGFKINSRFLVYQPPTAANGYWLSDFEGYNPSARRPSNSIQYEYALEEQSGTGIGTGYGKPHNTFGVRVAVPNTAVVHKWATETAIMADTLTVTESISGVDVTLASTSLSSLSETNYYLTVSIDVDLSNVMAGSTVIKNYKIWYGDVNDYKKFQIPDGSTVTMYIKVLNVGVNVTASYDPLDNFPPLTIDSATLYNGVYDSFNKRFTLTYLNIEGVKKTVQESPKNFYWSFENSIGWSLKYEIFGNSGTKVPSTTVPSTMYYVADATGTPGRYYVRWSGSLVFDSSNVPGGIESGDTIQFRMIPTSYYNPI